MMPRRKSESPAATGRFADQDAFETGSIIGPAAAPRKPQDPRIPLLTARFNRIGRELQELHHAGDVRGFYTVQGGSQARTFTHIIDLFLHLLRLERSKGKRSTPFGAQGGHQFQPGEFAELRDRFAQRGYQARRVVRADDGRATYEVARGEAGATVLTHAHDVRSLLAMIEGARHGV